MSPYPHMSNLLFAMPMTGRPIWPDVMFAYHSMAMPMNWNHHAIQIKGKPIDEARTICAETAINNNCRYIFFWDEDVAPPPQTLPELIYKAEHHPDAAIIGGIYCLKREPAEPLVFRGNGNGPFWDWKVGEFFEVSGVGTGCALVRTEVFKDLKKPWFKTEFNYEKMMDGTGGLESWTEDLWFCQRVTDTGKWKCYADGSIICGHYDMSTGKRYDLPSDSKPLRHLAVPKGTKRILDIGSGKNPYQTNEGTLVRADDQECPTDYRCDLHKLPFANAEFDIVYSMVLDQYEPGETGELLSEWSRVLKRDGELRLGVSDLTWAAQELLAGRIQPRQLLGKKQLNAFTYESLCDVLKEHGFNDVERVKSDPAHIAVRARRE